MFQSQSPANKGTNSFILVLSELESITDIDVVDFDTINNGVKIFSLSESDKIFQYKEHLKTIKKHFHYPTSHNAMILNFVLFNTSHWSQESIEKLSESKRIQSICEMAQKNFEFGCQDIDEDLSIDKLNQLVHTLYEMAKLANHGETEALVTQTEVCPPTEHHGWLNKMLVIYDDVCDKICPDFAFAQKLKLLTTGMIFFLLVFSFFSTLFGKILLLANFCLSSLVGERTIARQCRQCLFTFARPEVRQSTCCHF